MTEYDSSPAAVQNYMAKQARVGRWAADASKNSSSFQHPFQGMTAPRSTVPAHRGGPTVIIPSRSGTSRSPTVVSKKSVFNGTASPKSASVVSSSSRSSRTSARSSSSSQPSSRSSSHAPGSGTGPTRVSSVPRSMHTLTVTSPPSVHSGSVTSSGSPSTIAPSMSASQAGFARAPTKQSSLPPGIPTNGAYSAMGLNGQPAYSTKGVVQAEGYTVIPQKGQTLDVYIVPRG